jgi:hypothetical protein
VVRRNEQVTEVNWSSSVAPLKHVDSAGVQQGAGSSIVGLLLGAAGLIRMLARGHVDEDARRRVRLGTGDGQIRTSGAGTFISVSQPHLDEYRPDVTPLSHVESATALHKKAGGLDLLCHASQYRLRMSDDAFYRPNRTPPPRRQPTPGEPLWTLRLEHVTWSAELRCHGESWGWRRKSCARVSSSSAAGSIFVGPSNGPRKNGSTSRKAVVRFRNPSSEHDSSPRRSCSAPTPLLV